MLPAMSSRACLAALSMWIVAVQDAASTGAKTIDGQAPTLPELRIRVGDRRTVTPDRAGKGVALGLEIQVAEPLTIIADSWDCDAGLRLEDPGGRVLGMAEDGGIETNARLKWTATGAGPVILRVLANGAAGSVNVRVLRGAVDSSPKDPALAARAYWETAWDRARRHNDHDRTDQALVKCAALTATTKEALEADLLALAAVIGNVETRIASARSKQAAQDRPGACATLLEAEEILAGLHAEDRALVSDAFWSLASLANSLGDFKVERAALEFVVRFRERTLPRDDFELQRALNCLVEAMRRQQDFARACEIGETLLGDFERVLPDDHPELQEVRGTLAAALAERGDLVRARSLQEKVRSIFERTLPEEDDRLQAARGNLAVSILVERSDSPEARELLDKALARRKRNLSEDDPKLQSTRGNVAKAMERAGDLVGARALRQEVVSILERKRPPDHPELQCARRELANTMYLQHDFPGATQLSRTVIAVLERTRPADDLTLQDARMTLGEALFMQREISEARTCFEKALTAYERTLPPENPSLLAARECLALTMSQQGDFPGARALQEMIVEVLERTRPNDVLRVQGARINLATTMCEQGDLVAARASYEKGLESLKLTLPDDNDFVVRARHNLARMMYSQGETAGAREIEEKVVAELEKRYREEDPDLLQAQNNLAVLRWEMGELSSARSLAEKVFSIRERTLPKDDPLLQGARNQLALIIADQGDVARARSLEEASIAIFERTLPPDHPELQHARDELAWRCATLGDDARASELLRTLAENGISSLRKRRSDAAREREAQAEIAQSHLETIWSLGSSTVYDGLLLRLTFEWIEARRAVTDHADVGVLPPDSTARLAQMRQAVAAAREHVAQLVAGLSEAPHSEAERVSFESARAKTRDELPDIVAKRDAAERALNRALEELGAIPPEIRVEALASALPRESVAVGYFGGHRRRAPDANDATAHWESRVELSAFVLGSDHRVQRVDLGDLAEIEALARGWRAAIEAPIVRGAAPVAGPASPSAEELGEKLRKAVFDPVRAVAPSAKTFYVCLDDVLHLVPLEALPLDSDAVVGDRYRLRFETSFTRLVAAAHRPTVRPDDLPCSALLIGAVDYDVSGEDAAVLHEVAAASPPLSSERAGPGGLAFGAIDQTEYEADAIASYFKKSFDHEACVLKREQATKAALVARSPHARYVHLATHGYFSDAAVRWRGELEDRTKPNELSRPQSLEERVVGMSPMALCGLALTGANRGRDPIGRIPGILTAEELAGLDLRDCELAVLSACETDVGIRRAGLAINSLQKALHMAGAKTAITSLWRVDDRRTRDLMSDFYRRLWICKTPKAEALWEAKRALRASGAPPKDWAGWILTGDPGDEPASDSSKPTPAGGRQEKADSGH